MTKMKSETSFANIKVGDKFFTQERYTGKLKLHIVDRLTKTTFITNYDLRFDKITGKLKGSSDGWNITYALHPSGELYEQYYCEILERRINRLVDEKIIINTKNYDEIKNSVDVLYKYIQKEKEKNNESESICKKI